MLERPDQFPKMSKDPDSLIFLINLPSSICSLLELSHLFAEIPFSSSMEGSAPYFNKIMIHSLVNLDLVMPWMSPTINKRLVSLSPLL